MEGQREKQLEKDGTVIGERNEGGGSRQDLQPLLIFFKDLCSFTMCEWDKWKLSCSYIGHSD